MLAGVRRIRLDCGVDEPGCPVQHALDRVFANRDFCELVLDGAEGGDRLAELPALRRVGGRLADDRAGAAAAHGCQLEPAVVEHVERDLVSLANLAEHVRRRHPCVLQDQRRGGGAVQPHLVFFLAGAHAGKGALDEKRREGAVAAVAVDLCEHDEEVGEAAIGDPHLLAAEREAAVRQAGGSRLRAERVRARSRFAQRIRADHLAADEPRQILRLLLLGAEAEQRRDREAGLGAEGGRERRGPPNRFADDDRRHFVEPDAADASGTSVPRSPSSPRPANQLARQRPVLLFETLDCRQHLLGDELVRGLSDEPMLVGQLLGREDRHTSRILDQPRPAAHGCRCQS